MEGLFSSLGWQLQEGQLRCQQFALAFIHSGPKNSQGQRQGLVLWPLIVHQVGRHLCVSSELLVPFLCTVHAPWATVNSLLSSQLSIRRIWNSSEPSSLLLTVPSIRSSSRSQHNFSLSRPAGSWSCPVLLAVDFSLLLWSVSPQLHTMIPKQWQSDNEKNFP